MPLALLCLSFATTACGSCADNGPMPAGHAQPPLEPERRPEAPRGEDDAPAGAELDEEIAAGLEALGYVDTARADNPDERGVTARSATADPGLNLYSTRRLANAVLTDMDGEVVHQWTVEEGRRPVTSWMHVEPLPNGDLLSISRDHFVSRHDFRSALLWRTAVRAHHDLAVRRDGHILVLTRSRGHLTHEGSRLPILTDGIAVLSPSGAVVTQHELLPLLRPHVSGSRLDAIRERLATAPTDLVRPGGLADVLHANSITILHRPIEGVAPEGSLLLSFRALSRVAIVSADVSALLWIWGQGELDGQHDATQLANGRILMFDNGLRRGDSRVVEVDARTGAVTWSWSDPGVFTRLRGGAQGLPNGNVLITESDRGRALEITRSGERVWEFWNPSVEGSGDGAQRATIYRLNRFPRSFFAPLSD